MRNKMLKDVKVVNILYQQRFDTIHIMVDRYLFPWFKEVLEDAIQKDAPNCTVNFVKEEV